MIHLFESARFKLTAWYLLIIMAISILFSFVIYEGVNSEFVQFERLQQIREERIELGLPLPRITRYIPPSLLNPAVIADARSRLITRLVFINLGIFVLAGAAGYFLAGRTLKPIEEMVEEQNRFITDASHELRTPLTALRSEIEVGLMNKKLSLHEAKDLITSNLEEVVELQKLSENLLELTQYEKNKEQELFEEVHVKEIIEQAIDKVESLAKRKKITITYIGADSLIKGSKDRLRELFIILFDNAIKYSSPKSTVNVTNTQSKKYNIVTVSDNGIGIDEKDMPHIFDRFYRADLSRSKANVAGYGLGLSIAKKVVDIHNGKIQVTSKPNKGTTFTVILPKS